MSKYTEMEELLIELLEMRDEPELMIVKIEETLDAIEDMKAREFKFELLEEERTYDDIEEDSYEM